MTIITILDNAPEGEDSDVVDITGACKYHCNHLNSEGFWSELHITPESPRSLADIKRIAELEKERDKYKAHYDLAIEKEYPKKKFPRAYAQAKELKKQGK